MVKKKIAGLILGCLLMVEVAEARRNAALLGVAAAAVVGTAIIVNSRAAPPPPRYYEEPRRYNNHRRSRSVTITPNMKIQKSLTNLGLYQGKIDGKLSTYTSRTAIKKLNTQYGLGGGASLDDRSRDQLLYLSDLYQIDNYLFAEGKSKRSKNKRIQAALKVHGTYFGKIDGIAGNGTRKAIALYKNQEGLSLSTRLSPDERYDLISTAKQMNTKAIDEAIAALAPRQRSTPAPGAMQQDEPSYNTPRDSQSDNRINSREDEMPEMPALYSDQEQSASPSQSRPTGVSNENQNNNAAPGFE